MRGRIAAIALLVGVIMMPASTQAAGFNLTLSPLPISLTTQPGQTVVAPLHVQNTGTEKVHIKVSLMKFGAFGSTGEPSIETPSPNDPSVKWVSFSKTSFDAEPNVLNTVVMTIKVPKDAAFGYYYAAVFSQDNGNQSLVAGQNKIAGAVASLVLLDVKAPGEKRQLQVTHFTSTKKLYQYLPAEFAITVKNTGNIHAIPTGNIFIHRTGSKDFIGTLSINKEQGNVLPHSSRVFTTTWEDGFPSYTTKRVHNQVVADKRGQPVKELNWNLANANKFRFGHYSASMTLVYNDGQRDIPVNGEVSFWVIPWIPLLIGLVILALVAIGLTVLVRAVMRRMRRLHHTKAKHDA